MKVLTHTYERMLGSVNGTQAVPGLKNVLSWDSETVKPTNSIYLELIPEKADCKETFLYALSIIEELFVHKLEYDCIAVCGDGLTVNLLY